MRCSFLEKQLQLLIATAGSLAIYWDLFCSRSEIRLVLGQDEPGSPLNLPHFMQLQQQVDSSFSGVGMAHG